MTSDPKISLRDDGPLVVTNAPNLTGPDGTEIETKEVAALCRCGRSANKPFCDGAHSREGFSSAPDHSKIRNSPLAYTAEVEGVPVTVSYTPVLCTHAAECQRLAGTVFDPKQKPWIQPDKGKLADILNVIAACPSGALRVSVGDTEPHHMTTGDISIRVEKNGPYHVTNVALEAEFNGAKASRTKFSLCRCGLSKNKPFCDGTHYDENWTE